MFHIPSVDEAVAARFGDVKAELRRQGMLIEDCDLFIAATALAYTLTLVTNNVDHFRRIPDLAIDTWV
jgi:tRNA(fMet)-specific endonuclease VapC